MQQNYRHPIKANRKKASPEQWGEADPGEKAEARGVHKGRLSCRWEEEKETGKEEPMGAAREEKEYLGKGYIEKYTPQDLLVNPPVLHQHFKEK